MQAVLSRIRFATVRAPLAGLAVALAAACADAGSPTAPAPAPVPGGPQEAIARVVCRASVTAGTVRCDRPEGALIVGGQDEYVTLSSANIAVTADTFAFDVTVTNLISQAIGTTDGETRSPTGVRVFFENGPASTGIGTMSVANEDGTGTFTASGQPYFQYDTLLSTDETTAPRRWKLQFSPEVESFTFAVYVAADVQFPDGFVFGNPYVLTLNPGETRTVSGLAATAVGNPTGEAVTFVSGNASVVSFTGGNQATAGGSPGFTEAPASAGVKPNVYTTAVSVCPAQVVADGAVVNETLEPTDCASSFGSEDFRPDAEFYGNLFRITLSAGQTLTLDLESPEFDTAVTLADPQGFPVAYNDDISGTDFNSHLEFTATQAGTYVIEVSSSFFEPGGNGGYALTVGVGP
jgi:hypothetical protein